MNSHAVSESVQDYRHGQDAPCARFNTKSLECNASTPVRSVEPSTNTKRLRYSDFSQTGYTEQKSTANKRNHEIGASPLRGKNDVACV